MKLFGRKKKEMRQKREALQAQVRWCREMALDAYIKGDPVRCNDWTREAAKAQDRILQMYTHFQKPIKTRRTIIVPVTVPSRKKLEVAE